MAKHKPAVRALCVYREDPHLRATVRSVIGYRAECQCHAHGPTRARYADARPDVQALTHRDA